MIFSILTCVFKISSPDQTYLFVTDRIAKYHSFKYNISNGFSNGMVLNRWQAIAKFSADGYCLTIADVYALQWYGAIWITWSKIYSSHTITPCDGASLHSK